MKVTARLWQLTQAQLALLLHLRLAWVIALAVVGLVAGSASLRSFSFGAAEPRFLQSVAEGVIQLAGTLLVALGGPALFFGGLTSRATELLLSRGVLRAELLVAQLLALLVGVGWLLVLGAVALAALLASLGHSLWIEPALRAVASGATPLVVLAGVSLFAAAIGRSMLFSAVLTLAIALAGHLAPVLAHNASESTGIARAAWTLMQWVVPNFPAMTITGLLGVAAAASYAALFVGGAAWVFSRREL